MALDAFPSPAQLWQRYFPWKGLDTNHARHTVEMPMTAQAAPPVITRPCDQQHCGACREGAAAPLAGNGYPNRKDLHRTPEHLAAVEVEYQEAHPLSGRYRTAVLEVCGDPEDTVGM